MRGKKESKLLVIGTGKNGTSLLMALLSIYGLDLADTPRKAKRSKPIGYWEHPEFKQINLDILRIVANSGNFINPPALPPGWEDDERLLPLLERARLLRPFVLKYPGASLFLPFWDRVFDLKLLWIRRDREATIKSLMRRRRVVTRKRAERMFDKYVTAIQRDSSRLPMCCVRYEDLLEKHPSDVLDQALTTLGIGPMVHDRDRAFNIIKRP